MSGRVITTPSTVITREDSSVSVMQLPTVMESCSRCFAPKYCETMMPAPVEMPMKSTSRRLMTGLLAPTAASAPSPTYCPTTMLSTVE